MLLSAVSLCSCLAKATTSAKPFSGPYVGVGVGFSQLNIKRNESLVSPDDTVDSPVFASDKSSNSKKPVLSIHGGYDYHFQNDLVLGIELSLNFSFHNDTFNKELWDSHADVNHVSSSSIKNAFNVKLLMKAGKAFDNHLVYGAIGPVVDKFDVENTNSLTVGGGLDHSYASSKKHSIHRFGYVFGIGYAYAFKNTRVGFLMLHQPRIGISKKQHVIITKDPAADPLSLKTDYKASQCTALVQVSFKL